MSLDPCPDLRRPDGRCGDCSQCPNHAHCDGVQRVMAAVRLGALDAGWREADLHFEAARQAVDEVWDAIGPHIRIAGPDVHDDAVFRIARNAFRRNGEGGKP